MPNPTPCSSWPCPNLRPCPIHQPYDPDDEHARNTRRAHRRRIYNSTRWRRLRRHYLTDNPWCATPGCPNPATDLDHTDGIDAILDRNADPFDPAELQGLCHQHHSIKTAAETGTRGRRNTRGTR